VPLLELADSKTNIVVDRSGVDFIASLGMRSLVVASKTLARNARMLVLLNPTPLVADALTKAGLHALLPMVHSDSEAQGLLIFGLRTSGRNGRIRSSANIPGVPDPRFSSPL
jgi:anti-anti-sigma regulatory factor